MWGLLYYFRRRWLPVVLHVCVFICLAVWLTQNQAGSATNSSPSNRRFVIVNVAAYPEATGDTPLEANAKQYCARHGYDLGSVRQVYPFFDHECSWNGPSTPFAVTRLLLPSYDWVMYKQVDSVFVNMNITLEQLVSQVPSDAHMVVPAQRGYYVVDTAAMFRNSAQGRDIIQRLISLQRRMHACPAPGMAAVNTFFLHQMNGSTVNGTRVLYMGECETTCHITTPNLPHTRASHFLFQPYFQCLDHWFEKFGVTDWDVRRANIPGVWVVPARDDALLRSGIIPVGDDIAGFGNCADWVYWPNYTKLDEGFACNSTSPQTEAHFLKTYNLVVNASLLQTAAFKARFNNTLQLHSGGGDGLLAKVDMMKFVEALQSLFPVIGFRERRWNITDPRLAKPWAMEMSRFWQRQP
jgi:hypothetical protein